MLGERGVCVQRYGSEARSEHELVPGRVLTCFAGIRAALRSVVEQKKMWGFGVCFRVTRARMERKERDQNSDSSPLVTA